MLPPRGFVPRAARLHWSFLPRRSDRYARAELIDRAVPLEIKYHETVKMTVPPPTAGFSNGWCRPAAIGNTASVSITVLSVTPMRAGKLFALAAVEVDIEGIPIEIHGIRAMHVPPAATRIELPTDRDAADRSRAAIVLPEGVRRPIGDAVWDRLVGPRIKLTDVSALPGDGKRAAPPPLPERLAFADRPTRR
jgi:stage V sporulation protein G